MGWSSELVFDAPGPTEALRVGGYRVGIEPAEIVDYVAVEEPLEIRVLHWDSGQLTRNSVAVTMRTPGNDFELAVGFLYSEGVIRSARDIQSVSYCTDPDEPQRYNIVNVQLAEGVGFNPESLSRRVFTSSACGVCGTASLEQLEKLCPVKPEGNFTIKQEVLFSLPSKLRGAQRFFQKTGGLHASALIDIDGSVLAVREDVGRHNAMDKLVGHLLLDGGLPASNKIVLVSGRAGFELVQKAVLAGIPMLVAIGAPSSLAVKLAEKYSVTLVGFLREDRFNVYSAPNRIC
ncbi:MAG: formate dehydrogenase accessory sulfurtransferase FdhD [Thermoprotei archaeon]